MLCRRKLIFLLVITFLLFSAVTGNNVRISAETDPASLPDTEREILAGLFTLRQEMDEQKRLQEMIQLELENLQQEILSLEKSLDGEKTAFEENRQLLKAVLRTYQKRGAASYLEFIMESTSLRSLLWRLNALRNLSRGTAALLAALKENTSTLEKQKTALSEKLLAMEEQQQQLDGALAKNSRLAGQLEQKLKALGSQREFYEAQLAAVQQAWSESKVFLSAATRELNRIIKEGNLPEEALAMRISLYGITGTINETTLNELLALHPILKDMVFGFSPGSAVLAVKDKNLLLIGSFVIVSGHTLQFQAQEGYFQGLPLEPSSLAELFAEAPLMLNLEAVLEDYILRSVEIGERSLRFEISPRI